MKLAIEIRPGEGGKDARLLVDDQGRIYLRYAERHALEIELDRAPG